MLDNRLELMRYRMESAKERLRSAKILLDSGSYKDSIGRSYYAMFTSMRAILALEGLIIQNTQVLYYTLWMSMRSFLFGKKLLDF